MVAYLESWRWRVISVTKQLFGRKRVPCPGVLLSLMLGIFNVRVRSSWEEVHSEGATRISLLGKIDLPDKEKKRIDPAAGMNTCTYMYVHISIVCCHPCSFSRPKMLSITLDQVSCVFKTPTISFLVTPAILDAVQ